MSPLKPWMRYLLRFAGWYNILTCLNMLLFYDSGFKAVGLAQPELMYPYHLAGICIGLFGVGYLMVASRPLEHRGLLLLGTASKMLGATVGFSYVALGQLPPAFAVMLFFSELCFLPPFLIILRRLYGIAADD